MNEFTEQRKRAHIETVLKEDVGAKGVTTGFERFFFDHAALPELDFARIDLSTTVFGRKLSAPFLISSMTGGTAVGADINRNLAEAAQELGVAMGLGSQRAAIERPDLVATYRVRRVAPDVLLFANLGAVQLNYGYGIDEVRRAIDMIEADALFLHLNPLQEAVQPGGNRNWDGLLARIEAVVRKAGVPVVAKEIGNGIDAATAKRLAGCGVAAIDVAGAGGTSWSEVEAHRQTNPLARRVAHDFAGWGIPTALALIEVARAVPHLPVFASGGIRTGIDAAKAIRFGASLVGSAAPMLGTAVETSRAVRDHLQALIDGLRIAAFCTGSRDLASLARAPIRRSEDWSLCAAPRKPTRSRTRS